jgi:glycosyltransferase involved in cell wall biosynthesis
MKYTYILVPVFNEEDIIDIFIEKFLAVSKKENNLFKIVFIDDGSNDTTWEKIKKITSMNSDITGIKLIKNFGKDTAVKIGFDYLKDKDFESVVVMDGDLQHPIETVYEFIKLRKSFKVIQGIRKKTNSSFIRKFLNKIFYFVVNILSDTKIKNNSTDFCLIDKCYFDFIRSELEFDNNLKITISRLESVGFVNFLSPERTQGNSKFSFKKLIFLAIELIIKKASTPLKFIIALVVFLTFMIGIFLMYYLNNETGYNIIFYLTLLNTLILVFTLLYLFYIAMRVIYLPINRIKYDYMIEDITN